MKYMMVIKYDGSKFYGFQRQNNVRNVQGYVENVISNILNSNIVIKGAGRTDKGVHANYQVVHFESNAKINNLKKEANRILKDVKIKKVIQVDDEFHARHSVTSKTYIYKIDLSNRRDSNYYLNINYTLDINKMRRAIKLFLGTHNFKNFVSGERENYNTTITSCKIYKFNKVLYIKFSGIGFYRYMVRNLVGALIAVGKGKADIDIIKDMLENPDKEKRLPTSSPNGLYLAKIEYKKRNK